MIRTYGSRLLLISVAVGVAAGIQAQTTRSSSSASQQTQYRPFLWWEEPWTGDNKPYRGARVQIDRLVAKGGDPLALAIRYKALALKDKFDPVAQFRWAYAARKAALASKPFGVNKVIASYQALEAVHRINRPHAYDFTRLRFLTAVDVLTFPERQELRGVGRRLVERDPKDVGLRYQWVRILVTAKSIGDRREGIRQAQLVLGMSPKKSNYRWLVANAHDGLWSLTKKRSDANRAIAAYRRMLTPRSSKEDRDFVESQIKLINYFQTKWEKNGKGTRN